MTPKPNAQRAEAGRESSRPLSLRLLSLLIVPLMGAGILAAPTMAAADEPAEAAFVDDFARADGELGNGWIASRGQWGIVGEEARVTVTGTSDNVASYAGVELQEDYTVTADVTIATNGAGDGREWSGLVGNLHTNAAGSLDYYLFRFSTQAASNDPTARWQMLRVSSDTSLTLLGQGTFDGPIGTPLAASLTRTSTEFALGLTNRSTGATLLDTSVPFAVEASRAAGTAGLYSNANHLRALGFGLTTSAPTVEPPDPGHFIDEFARADGALGNGWVASRGAWGIAGGEARVTVSGTSENVASYSGIQLGETFTVSADVSIAPNGAGDGREWSGLVANLKMNDAGSLDYYLFRFSTQSATNTPTARWQVLRVSQSTSLTPLSEGTFNGPIGTPLTATMTRDGAQFAVHLENRATGETLVDSSVAFGLELDRIAGAAGLYSISGNLRATTFRLESSTPPAEPPAPMVCDVEGDPYALPSNDLEVIDSSELGITWAGMYVVQDLLTRGDKQYVAFYDTDRQMVVAERSLGDEIGDESDWSYKVLPTTLGWDSHNATALGLDRNGTLHVSGNMHNVPLIYFRSAVGGDVSTLTQVATMVSSETENSATYPKFLNRADGSLVFTYRNGSSGSGDTYFNVYDEAAGQWSRLIDLPLFNGNGTDANPTGTWNAYFEGPTLGPDGNFHMLWVWRDTPDSATNSMLSYARSSDLLTWFDAQGNPLATPFRYGEGDVVDPIPNFGGLLNGNARLGFDGDGNVLITYHKYDADGDSQLYAARPDGAAWQISQISDWTGRWSFGGGGTITTDVSMAGSTALDNGDIQVSYRCYGKLMAIVVDSSLQPITQITASGLPSEVTTVRGDYPGLRVYTKRDSGHVTGPPTDRGTYLLRWESLPQNLDQPREEWPEEGSVLEVVLLADPTEPEPETPAAWSASTAYDSGDEVSYDGRVYVAQWWTEGHEPGASVWSAWAEVGDPVSCADAAASTWTNSWIYNGGERVAHDGYVWQAQWWTRNQVPGASGGPWSQVSAC